MPKRPQWLLSRYRLIAIPGLVFRIHMVFISNCYIIKLFKGYTCTCVYPCFPITELRSTAQYYDILTSMHKRRCCHIKVEFFVCHKLSNIMLHGWRVFKTRSRDFKTQAMFLHQRASIMFTCDTEFASWSHRHQVW